MMATPNTAVRRFLPLFAAACLALCIARPNATHAQNTVAEAVEINPSAASHPFPHFWEKVFGSGRAILSLLDDYRHDLRKVKRITDFDFLRFHAIFHDEVSFYDDDASGNPIYKLSYVDQTYDGVLANKVKPFIEPSIM